jgi:hypothetical protein
MKILKWFLLWLVLALGIAFSTGRRCLEYYQLSRSGILTQGVVREFEPHQQLKYVFTANGVTYSGIGRTGIGVPPFAEIAIGDAVPVYYLQNSPSVNALGNPRELYMNDLPLVLLVSLLFPSLILIVLRIRLSKTASIKPRCQKGSIYGQKE